MQARLRRFKDLPRITKITTSSYEREFPVDQEEFIVDVKEMPYLLHDGNMEFIEYIDDGIHEMPKQP